MPATKAVVVSFVGAQLLLGAVGGLKACQTAGAQQQHVTHETAEPVSTSVVIDSGMGVPIALSPRDISWPVGFVLVAWMALQKLEKCGDGFGRMLDRWIDKTGGCLPIKFTVTHRNKTDQDTSGVFELVKRDPAEGDS